MSGVSKIEIHESGEALLALMKQQKKLPNRPNHQKQDTQAVDEFPHRLMSQLRRAVRVAPDLQLRYWVEDESRFGLKPIRRRLITARGVAPISIEYWRFDWLWLYGLVEPLTGDSFF